MSVATAVWLVLQVGAGLSTSTAGWPVSGIPMYSDASPTWHERELVVTTESGRTDRLTNEDFDLRGAELQQWLRRHVGVEQPTPGAESALAALAAAYDRRHPDDPATRLVHHITIRAVDRGHRVLAEPTVVWERP